MYFVLDLHDLGLFLVLLEIIVCAYDRHCDSLVDLLLHDLVDLGLLLD